MEDDLVNNWLLLTRNVRTIDADMNLRFLEPRSHLKCKSGLVLSIQAGEYNYCAPKNNEGPYASVEVMIIKGHGGAELDEYITDDSVIGYIPVEVLNKVIENNGGIDLTKEKEK